ncbi:recombinase family protein [Nocardia sp. NPDC101769]|uniref:recombinase family protein n=1 Tax=Nocardia sp. NPDC101769 TaxID=3364333 RepID=UPI00382ECC8B
MTRPNAADLAGAPRRAVGRPRSCPDDLLDLMLDLRDNGMSYRQIADHLNHIGMPGATNEFTRWHGKTVWRLLHTRSAHHYAQDRGARAPRGRIYRAR